MVVREPVRPEVLEWRKANRSGKGFHSGAYLGDKGRALEGFVYEAQPCFHSSIFS
jgi:hypothetical protein